MVVVIIMIIVAIKDSDNDPYYKDGPYDNNSNGYNDICYSCGYDNIDYDEVLVDGNNN